MAHHRHASGLDLPGGNAFARYSLQAKISESNGIPAL
jgi:hypothetical protein